MHGVIRIVTELEGETVEKCDVEIGAASGFEKSCEQGGYNQAIPYTDASTMFPRSSTILAMRWLSKS
jgi:NADH:ubiquinone oxidoreductase subunit D